MGEFIKNLHNSGPAVIKQRLYLQTTIVALFLLTMILVSAWTGNTLTMITAIARFERTHTVSRLEAKASLLEYLDTRNDQAKESFYENMTITQSYNKVFSNLLIMRSSTSKKEFAKILESTFKEADHKTAVIIVNRIKVLYWHPIVKELVGYADKAHNSGETIVALASLAMDTENKEKQQSFLQEIRNAEIDFIFYERSFSKRCSDLANEIATLVDYFYIAILILSVGFTSLITYFLANSLLQQAVKHARDLKESQERVDLAIKGSNDAPWDWNLISNELYYSPQWWNQLGYALNELPSDAALWERLMHPDDADHVDTVFRDALKSGIASYEVEFRLLHKDGHYVPILSRGFITRDKTDNPIRVTGTNMDLSERKQAEEEKERLEDQIRQSQKVEAIGTLAGGIAHDFNNILSSIIGYTELALFDLPKGNLLHENLSEVLSAGNRAKNLVKQILTLSRHDAVEFKPIHINSVVKEAVKMLRPIIPTSINIQDNLCNKQLVVQADPTQIHQVIINLVTNAQHAMSETGGILVVDVDTVSFDESSENINLTPGNYARITVSDTGTGINKEHLEKIFEPYFTTKSIGEGSGLGLSVVHGIVKAHKGDIAVYSEPGKGTKFHVYLSLSEQQSIGLPDTTIEPLPRGTERILLVDDEPSILKMQQQSLDRLGYTVTIKTSSVEALTTFCTAPDKYDLVITDMTMPDMTGDKLADGIKKFRPDMPVILCTGFSDKIKIRTGPDLQIDEFLLKPVDQNELAKIIRKLLDKTES